MKALALDPHYDEAMAYLNLLFRIEAGIWEDPALAQALIVKADTWVAKAIETKRKRASEPAPESMQLDPNGPAPGPAGRSVMVKAPPPPSASPTTGKSASDRIGLTATEARDRTRFPCLDSSGK